MIDTVILSLPKQHTVAFDDEEKGVLPWDLQSRSKAYAKFVRNPSLREKKSGDYYPRLTGYKRKYESTVKIEFSVPKLLYGNNLDEVSESQFEEVVEVLRERLSKMGIKVWSPHIQNAKVTAVHYSKNIELTGGYTSQYVIRELNKVNLNKRFDFTRARYMNEGQSLYAYSAAHSIVVYDKVADLARDKSRAIDKDQTPTQLSLFDNIKGKKEILRSEVRLSQKRKMNSVFKSLRFKENPTFKEVFCARKSQVVLKNYWNTMLSETNLILFAHSLTPKTLLSQILLSDQTSKTKTAVYLMGLLLLAKEDGGLRDLRAIVTQRGNDRAWYRVLADLRLVSSKLNKLEPREWHSQIEKCLDDFEQFSLGTTNFVCKEK